MVRGWGKSFFVSYLNALPTVVPAIGSDIAAVCVGRGEIKGRARSRPQSEVQHLVLTADFVEKVVLFDALALAFGLI
jgi:hypothetical protein